MCKCVNLYQEKVYTDTIKIIALFNTMKNNPIPNLRNFKTYDDVKLKKKKDLIDKIMNSFFTFWKT